MPGHQQGVIRTANSSRATERELSPGALEKSREMLREDSRTWQLSGSGPSEAGSRQRAPGPGLPDEKQRHGVSYRHTLVSILPRQNFRSIATPQTTDCTPLPGGRGASTYPTSPTRGLPKISSPPKKRLAEEKRAKATEGKKTQPRLEGQEVPGPGDTSPHSHHPPFLLLGSSPAQHRAGAWPLAAVASRAFPPLTPQSLNLPRSHPDVLPTPQVPALWTVGACPKRKNRDAVDILTEPAGKERNSPPPPVPPALPSLPTPAPPTPTTDRSAAPPGPSTPNTPAACPFKCKAPSPFPPEAIIYSFFWKQSTHHQHSHTRRLLKAQLDPQLSQPSV